MGELFSSETTPPLIPGYTLHRCIGRGSYGEVWLANDAAGQFVAVKVVHRNSFEHERPFEREFSGIRKFEPISRRHPSQVSILNVGVDEPAGYFYYVMELADDARAAEPASSAAPANPSPSPAFDPLHYVPKTLKKVLQQRGRLPYHDCLEIGVALATALEHLHQNGLIHRDIKPSNVIFVRGVPKLADIGLVTDVGASISYVGTEGFLPPEGPGTPRADLFSLGKVLYEISTGHDRLDFPELPTFVEETEGRHNLLELNQVILKACQTEPRHRYQSAQEMSAELRLLQRGQSVRRVRARQRRIVQIRLLALASVVVVGLAALFRVVQRNREAEQARQASRFRQQVQQEAQSLDQQKTRALVEMAAVRAEELRRAGDGAGALLWLAKAFGNEQDKDRAALRAQQYREVSATLRAPFFVLAHTAAVNTVRFSLNGLRLITAGDDQAAWVWDAGTGLHVGRPLTHQTPVAFAALTPGGERALTLTADGQAQVWRELDNEPVSSTLEPAWRWRKVELRPDGRQILGLSQSNEVVVWETGGRQLRFTFGHPRPVCDASFSPDNKLVATIDEGGMAQVWQTETGQRLAKVEHLGPNPTLVFSPDSRRLASYAGNELRLWNARSGALASFVLKHEGTIRTAAFTPDSQNVVTGSDDHALRLWDGVTGQSLSKPKMHPGSIQLAQVSPDGQWVATVCGTQLRLWPVNGSDLAAPMQALGKPLTDLSFSPAGHVLAYAGADGAVRGLGLGKLPLTDGKNGEAIMEWAELCAGRRLSLDAGMSALSGMEQRALWEQLHGPPQIGFVEFLLGWHQEQGAAAELAQNGFAAMFHWQNAARLQPSNETFRAVVARLATAKPAPKNDDTNSVATPPRLARAADTSPRLLDLSAFYNASLVGGWLPTNVFPFGNDLAELPSGVQKFGGTAFDVRGVIQLSGGALEASGGRFPQSVPGIPVKQRCRRLHFLHGTAWSSLAGVQVATYRVHYGPGDSVDVRVLYGRHLREWWSAATSVPLTPGAAVWWEGSNPPARALGWRLRLYQMTWINPRPDVEIVSIDLISAMENSAPFLLAVTTE